MVVGQVGDTTTPLLAERSTLVGIWFIGVDIIATGDDIGSGLAGEPKGSLF
ncbi:hypothetical protein ES708_25438 [subsurface metagenome]